MKLDRNTIITIGVLAAGYYYFNRRARSPGAMINEAAKDVKGGISTVANTANAVVDIGAGGASTVADTAQGVVNKAIHSVS